MNAGGRPRHEDLRRDERGAGSVIAVGIMAASLSLAALSIPLYSVLAARQAVAGAADAAALAAADVVIGLLPGVPCAAAATVAAANRTKLLACQPDGLVVTVRAAAYVFGFEVTALATAGPLRTEGE